MPLIVLRCVFVLVAAGVAYPLVTSSALPQKPAWTPWAVFALIMLIAMGVIFADVFIKRKRIDVISAVFIGMTVGLFLTYVAGIALTPWLEDLDPAVAFNGSNHDDVRRAIQLTVGMILCYACISVLMQTKDDFRFIIPYVEFSRQVKGLKPYILDTSVVIDGRIADVVETSVMDNQLIMPRFILAELQNIADSNDKLRRSRGRRGLGHPQPTA